MALRQIVVSDLSGAELSDDDHARVTVEHPDYPGVIELDISVEEALRLQDSTLRLVQFTIFAPNRPPRRAVVETKTLDKLFDGVDMEAVFDGARRAATAPSSSAAARSAAPASARASKVDYGSADHAGVLHRGRVTEREASFVRANLDRANANRAREGQPAIDPDDPKERQRYGW
jgi:hypothetical protein